GRAHARPQAGQQGHCQSAQKAGRDQSSRRTGGTGGPTMKKLWLHLVVLSMAVAGCVDSKGLVRPGPTQTPQRKGGTPNSPAGPPAVTPEQVQEGNARDMASKLCEELDWEAQHETTLPDKPSAGPARK